MTGSMLRVPLCVVLLGTWAACANEHGASRGAHRDAASVAEDGGRATADADAGGARESMKVIARGEDGPWSIAIDDRFVYWTTRSALRRAPLAGGEAMTLASSTGLRRVVAADGAVFVSDGPAGTVSRVDRETGAAKVIGTGVFPDGIAVRDGEVFWSNGGMSVGDGAVVRAREDGAGAVVVIGGLAQPSGIALDDQFLYVTSTSQGCGGSSGGGVSCFGGGITKVPRASGARMMLDEQTTVAEIASGERGVYWLATPGPILMFAPAGSNPEELAKLTGEEPGPLAVDVESVYVSSPGRGRVLKVPLDGGTAAPLLSDLGQVGGVAVDRDWVYVAATSEGRILRVAKDGSAAKPAGPITGPCPMPIGSAEEIAATPRDDANLELLALALDTAEIVATQETYDRVIADVAAIRALEPSIADVGYLGSNDGKQLLLSPDDKTMQSIAAGEYSAWDCLNDFYQLDPTKPMPIQVGSSFVVITLKGQYHLGQLSDLYAKLPGIESVEPNSFIGDGPSIHARHRGDDIEYIVDRAGGDCPAGCTSHDAHFFVSTAPGVVEAMGSWNSEAGEMPPAWFWH